jgi:hypothetical protein
MTIDTLIEELNKVKELLPEKGKAQIYFDITPISMSANYVPKGKDHIHSVEVDKAHFPNEKNYILICLEKKRDQRRNR